ncbi:hypothetical protein A3K64_01840 [Candidatus Micrarchaeota archaeon RBG_16_36_9]|nr:MAG: hypothetical protein A3K64_01840 [Candidatus Micrarchaeota archaeon RBG_16_36_9]
MILDLNKFVDKYSVKFTGKNKIKIYIKKGKGRKPKEIILNRFIEVGELFVEVIGLYYGDGLKSLKGSGNRQVYFSNTCTELHNMWIKFLGDFGIRKDNLFVQVVKGFNITSNDCDIITRWSEKLDMKSCRFRKIKITQKRTKPYGYALVIFQSIIFRNIFNNVFNYIVSIIDSNENFIKWFLKGLFAAEGHVEIKDNNSIQYISLTSSERKRRIFIGNLFKLIGIKYYTNIQAIVITGYLNFELFEKFNLSELHPDKKRAFETSMKVMKLSNRNFPALSKKKIIKILKIMPMTRFELSTILNLDKDAVFKNLKDLETKNIIVKSGKIGLRQIWKLNKIPSDEFILAKDDYREKCRINFAKNLRF